MDDFDKLFEEMEKEYPELADLYDFVMANCAKERLCWEYERGRGYKHLIDKAKGKYLIILKDMGLFQSE